MFRCILKNSQKFILSSKRKNFFSLPLSNSSNLPKNLTLPSLKDETLLTLLRNEILTHPSTSLSNNHPYKRYCFYGDKVYNYFVSRELFNKLPNASNAELTILTHQLVSRSFLAEVAIECGLDKLIKLAKNSPMSIGILSESIEAHFAIYILNGMEEEMKKFVADVVDFYFEKEAAQKKDEHSLV